MTPSPQSLRYELKFLAHGLSLPEAAAIVRLHPALFREVYPPRFINNIYLDTPGFQDYFDHVQGSADRLKTRIRWYGHFNGHIPAPTLERKIKRGCVGGKTAHPLPPLAFNGHVARDDLNSAMENAGLPPKLHLAIGRLQPALINRYQRRYWVSACGRFRLTLDWNLQFFACRAAAVSATPLSLHAPAVILELKFDPQHAESAAEVTNAWPFRMARCSKYVLGIERLYAG